MLGIRVWKMLLLKTFWQRRLISLLVMFSKLSKINISFFNKTINPFSAGTAFILMQTGWIQASRRVTRRLAWDPTCLPFSLLFMGNNRLSGKQVGSQASRRVTRRLAWIQPVCISINAVPALKGLNGTLVFDNGPSSSVVICFSQFMTVIHVYSWSTVKNYGDLMVDHGLYFGWVMIWSSLVEKEERYHSTLPAVLFVSF